MRKRVARLGRLHGIWIALATFVPTFLAIVFGIPYLAGLPMASRFPTDLQDTIAPAATAQPAPQIAEAPPLPPASKAGPVVTPEHPTPLPSPTPMRAVTTRSSGIVLSVNPSARTLVLQDMGAAAGALRLRVELAPDAGVVRSERDDQAEDLSYPFKDTVISLSDVRSGDFVVVEMRGPEGKALARSVVVTFRPDQGAAARELGK